MAEKTIWTDEEKQDIIKLYNLGYSFPDIGKKYQKDRTVIKKVITEANIPIRTASETKQLKKKLSPLFSIEKITDEDKEKILKQYVIEQKSIYQIQKELGFSQFIIEKVLKEFNVQKRTYVEAKQLSRKYSIDDNFFKTQSHDMAYILGLLASDGNVAKNENGIFLELEKTDEYLLKEINKLTNNSRPIKYYTHKHPDGTETNAAKLQVWSAEWKKDLSVYNIVPAKTNILKPPYFLNKKYYISYLKGYFDGDGSFYFNLNKYKWNISFCGASYEVISWIRNVFINLYGIAVGKIEKRTLESGNDFFRIAISGKENVKRVYQMWYQEETSSICLLRKKKKFDDFMEYFYSN